MGYAAKLGSSGKGKLAVVNLGIGTSINCSTHATLKDYYTELTVDNFYYRIANGAEKNTGTQSLGGDRTYVKFTAPSFSYNATTGVLTAGNGTAQARNWYIYGGYQVGTVSTTATTTSYCIYLE